MIYFPCKNAKKPFLEISEADYDRAVNVNGKMPFLISQRLIPGMQKIGHGRMVYISSIWSIKGHTLGGQDYAITKAMENQLAKQITAVFMNENITATSLIFSAVNLHQENKTDPLLFSEKDRVVSNREVADFIIRLLDENNRSFAGSTVMIDNGSLAISGV
jgi:NAD(P)-dependent dehydrogenase (short-subunit alcohol dehydrogenase family)